MFARKGLILFLVFILILTSTPGFFAEQKLSYTISPGDTLEISVWQHPELDKMVTVRPDGRISFSLIGDVNAAGLTAAELDEVITRRLSEYVQNPEVTVIVSTISIRSRHIIVLGQVVRPGAYPMEEGITLLEAVATAGGYTEGAALQKVTITRKRDTERPRVIKVDLKEVMAEGGRGGDVVLEPGDLVYFPKKSSGWEIFDRYFVRGILPVMGFFVMLDTLTKD